ncbi:chromosome condensation protein [Mucor ambiguus]|uniref:Chromosome condensation protein n=1 Tax=Mucor ambiguus TaxID=91626 RepID=A0A0C9LXZ9_9FUNG|nr:chromosome condensation protein [Mucor ambiguus]
MSDFQAKTTNINENKIAVAAAIIPFSIAGVLIRIALERLQDYTGAPVFGLVYAQWAGCLIIGLTNKNKSALFLWYHPLHPGITTGLCGSITTFSSWQLDTFKEIANYNAHPHTRGKNVLAALSEFLITFAMSLSGLLLGQHIGDLLSDQIERKHSLKSEPKLIARGFSFKYMSKRDYLTITFAIVSWLGVVFAAIFAPYQRDLAFACVFAPVGALTRWYLSFYNGRLPHFPIGTFAANVFGTIVLAILAVAQSGPRLTSIACDVIAGLADGYCGCLTTISTFMVELTTLPRKPSYIYGSLSVVIAQGFMFIILGSYIWSQGVNPMC